MKTKKNFYNLKRAEMIFSTKLVFSSFIAFCQFSAESEFLSLSHKPLKIIPLVYIGGLAPL